MKTTKKRKTLIISFDLIREGESKTSLSVASLLAYLKNDDAYGHTFTVDHRVVNMFQLKQVAADFNCGVLLPKLIFEEYDFIALSCFVWNESLVNPYINHIRSCGFSGKIILGGSQITYSKRDELKREYPGCDIFISGYAEKSLLNVFKSEPHNCKDFYNDAVDFSELVSPYLTNEIAVEQEQEMVRLETKRGCPYQCSFCAHRNLENGKVNPLEVDKVYKELAFLKEKNVKRVNVLDPVFNMGNNYLAIIREIERLNFLNTSFTFQSKIELLAKKDGKEFLDLAERTNSHLEFGLQTVIPLEYKAVNRKNNIQVISEQLDLLKQRQISYEISLIYGLPNQNVESFKASIDYVQSKGCKKVTAWPLMLLKGTPLYSEKEKYAMHEEVLGDFNIPVVTSNHSFTKDDWLEMKEIADGLEKNYRV